MSQVRFPDSATLRQVFRSLQRRPGFTAAAVLTLAIGIGATTAIFSVVYSVLLKPLPYPDAHRLVSLRHVAAAQNGDEVAHWATMQITYSEQSRAFEHVGLWADGGASLTGLGEPEQVRAIWVTDGALQALGVQPLLGRWFSPAEHTPAAEGAQPVIVSYGFWQRRFGGDESAVGRALAFDGVPSQVVGVMPAGFRFLDVQPQPDVIFARRIDRAQLTLSSFGFRGGVARLEDGVTLDEATADVERMLPIWLDAWPSAAAGPTREVLANWRIVPVLRPLKDDLVGSVAGRLWVLMGSIGAVLLIACANIANLTLVRADARRQELAIRAALGAGRGRIGGELLLESVALGALGGVLGIALACGVIELLVALGPTSLPRLRDIAVDSVVLAFAIGATLVSSLLFGSIPALKHALHVDVLGSAARGASASRERNSARNALIVVQVALALVLLVGAGLMIRTFQSLTSIDPGFSDPAGIQVARISIPPTVTSDARRYTQMQRDVADRIAALPGVTAVGFGFGAPMEETRTIPNPLYVEDQAVAPGELAPTRRFKVMSPGYLETVGTRLVAGRDVTWTDIEQGGKVAVISEGLARELWGSASAALGKRVRESAPGAPGIWREVIGVAQDVYDYGLHRPAPPTVYWPIMMESFFGNAQFGMPAIAYVIRSERAGTASLVSEVQQAVWSVNPDLPVFLIRTVQDLYAGWMAQTSFTLVLLGIAGAMALCLGVVGIYGVISYVVAQRSREIGIRIALGARPAVVQRMFVAHGLVLAVVGGVIGLAASAALGRWMSSLLFGVSALDPMTYVAVLAVLGAAVVIAAYVPARRASAVDPASTLKAE
jgi:putative ABC transport system permease protein